MLFMLLLSVLNLNVFCAVLPQPNPKITALLVKEIPANRFVLSKVEVKGLKQKFKFSTERLMIELIPVAKRNARPPISNYYVGAVGLTRSGRIIFGNNLEFKGAPISATVHAEQFLSVLSFIDNDRLEKIAVSAEPCGYCRQFLNEISGALKTLKILVPGKSPKYLGALLPDSFGPDNLKINVSIYAQRDNKIDIKSGIKNELVINAIKNANISYAPYSESYSGISLRLKDGTIFNGFYIENAAFNPSINPLTVAIIKMVSEDRQYDQIKEVVLFEKKYAMVKQEELSRIILKAIAPRAKFKVVHD